MNYHSHYKLVDRVAVPCSFEEWAICFQQDDRIIARDEVFYYLISTVFLGLNHQFTDGAPPILFETMVFDAKDGQDLDEFTRRYITYEQAEAGHQETIALIKALTGA